MTALPDGPLLAGIDFSADSHHAWAIARALAEHLGRPLVAVTAVDPLLAEAGRATYGDKFTQETCTHDLVKFLRDDEAAPGTSPRDFTPIVEEGEPSEALLRAARDQQAALIVVGTRGLGRTKRLFFGSTALKLLRHTDRPVLTVPHADAGHVRFDHIVCGVDFSEPSLHAARVATDLGRRLSIGVTLVNAVAQIAVPQTWDALAVSSSEQRLTEATSRLAELAPTLGTPAPSVSVRIGDVAEVVGAAAAEHASTLIVLGLGGRDGHRPGTHAHRILTDARTPVLAVPLEASR